MNKKVTPNNAKFVFEELEPRLLLSADGLGVITESSVATLHDLVNEDNQHTLIIQEYSERSSVAVHNAIEVSGREVSGRTELVIIDSRAPNFQQLHNDVIKAQQQGRDINVVILDAHRDGIQQISDAISQYNKLDAVHIVSHGKDGQLELGATQLNKQSLKQRSEEIAQWQDVFTERGDVLIYGCNLAESSDGTALVNSLSKITGADVAASDDVTGNSILGGDWELEYKTGGIETSLAFSTDVQENWQGKLDANAQASGGQQALAEEQQAAQIQQDQIKQNQIKQEEQQAEQDAELEAALLAEEEQTEIAGQELQQAENLQASTVDEQRLEIVFIDQAVDDYQSFIDDLNNKNNANGTINFEIVLLDESRNGVEQISETLSIFSDVDAVHIFSHGTDGSVKLGNTWLNASNIDDYGSSINSWGSSLDENADILIYGCNLASSESGEQFINTISALTNAEVAASDDLTGYEELGGDWDLEYKTGDVESTVAISNELQQDWESALAISSTYTQRIQGGGIAVDSVGMRTDDVFSGDNTPTLTISTIPSGATVVDAFLYINQLDNGTSDKGFTLNGVNFTAIEIGNSAESGWVGVTRASTVKVDVSAIVAANGIFTLGGAATGGILYQGASLVVVYEDTSVLTDSIIALHDGSATQRDTPTTDDFNLNILLNNGSALPVAHTNATVTVVAFDSQTNFTESGLTFQAASAGSATVIKTAGSFTGDSGGAEQIEFDISPLITQSDSSATLYQQASQDYIVYAFVGTVIELQNSAPTTSGIADFSIPEDSGFTTLDLKAAFADAEDPDTALTFTITGNTNPTLFDSLTITGTGLDTLTSAYAANQSGSSIITIRATDTGGLFVETSYTVTVNSVNDAPINNVPVAQSTNEDTVLVFNSANGNLISVSDVDAGSSDLLVYLSVNDGILTLSGTTGITFDFGTSNGTAGMAFSGTLSNINNALDGLTFTPDANFNGSVTLQMTTYDDVALLGSYQFDLSGDTGLDYSPSGNNDGVVNGAVQNTSGASPRDNTLQFNGATDDHVQINGRFGDPSSVTLAAWVNLTAAGTFGSDIISLGDDVLLRLDAASGGNLRGSYYDSTTSNWQETIFNVDLVNAGWHHIAYTIDDANHTQKIYLDGVEVGSTATTESIAYGANGANSYIGIHGDAVADWNFTGQIDDARVYGRALTGQEILTLASNAAVNSDGDSISITVNAANDTPTTGDTASGRPEDSTYALVNLNGSDVDGTVTDFRLNNLPANGTLYLDSGLTTVVVAGVDYAKSGILLPMYFVPDTNWNGQTTFDYVAKDDQGAYSTVAGTATITITAVNDAPIINASITETTDLNTPLTFSTGSGNAITLSDVDIGLGDAEVTLNVTNGTLSLNSIANLVFSSGTGTTDTNMTFTGTLSAINIALDGLQFDPTNNFNGTGTLQIIVDDQGGSGSGPALVDSTSVFIGVSNTTPVATNDPSDYNADIAALNPVSNWHLGEGSGTTVVDSGSANANGTVNGATLGQPGALNGSSNTAAYFDGVDDYIEITHANDFLLDDGTIQLWFNADSTGTKQALLSKDHDGLGTGGHVSVWLTSSGAVQMRLQSTTTVNTIESINAVTAGQWHHIALSFGSNGMELYVDGVITDVNGYTGGLGTTGGGTGNAESFVIGASNYQGTQGTLDSLQIFFQGSIDEVSIVASQLNGEQIQNIFAAGLQHYTIVENTSLNVATSEGVLINDADADGDSLTAVLVSGPSFASSFTLNPDGSFDYTPNAGFDGTDTFTYQASDGGLTSNIATVTITVTGNNDAPIVNATVSVAGTKNIDAVYTHAQMLTLIGAADADDVDANLFVNITNVTNGVLAMSGGTGGVGTIFTFTPTADFVGNLTFNYQVSDDNSPTPATSGTGTATVTLSNTAPVARDDRIGLVFDGFDDYVRIGDYATLNVSTTMTMEAWVKPDLGGAGSQVIINKEGEYELAIDAATGEVKWGFDNIDPGWSWYNTGYFVQANEWTHLAVSYANGDVSLYANGVLVDFYDGDGAIADNYPLLNELQIGGRENSTLSRFGGSIDEVRIWNLTRSQVDIASNMNTQFTSSESGLIGNWRFDESSGITVIDQSIFAHHGTLADGVITAEMPTRQGYNVDEDGTLNVSIANGVLTNDFDITGDALTAVLVSGPSNAASFNLNPDGSFIYTPTADFNGIDSFTYRANDGGLNSNIATVIIHIHPVNDAPVINSPGSVFINEIHYDNAGGDVGEAIEIAGKAGTDLSGWTLALYNGSTNDVYGTIALSGVFADQSNGYGVQVFNRAGIQNDTDGVALVDNTGRVVQFISYEGVITAVGGPANGMASTDILVAENTSTLIGSSLQLTGTGSASTWAPSSTNTFGSINSGQSFAQESVAEDTVLIFSAANNNAITISDVDASVGNPDPMLISLSVSNGVINLASTSGLIGLTGNGSNTITFSGSVAEVNTALDGLSYLGNVNFNGTDSLVIQVNDQGNTGTGGALIVSDNVDITVTAVNDAPTATNLSAAETYTEDTALNLTNIVVSDVDSTNTTVTLTLSDVGAGALSTANSNGVMSTFVGGVWTASGAIVDVNTLLAGVIFNPTLNYNSDFDIATSVSDGFSPAVPGTKSFTAIAVNDAPVLTNGANIGFSEGNGALPFSGETLSDVDSADFDGGVLTFTIASGDDGSETLRLNNFLGVTTTGSNVYVSGILVGTQAGGTSSVPFSVTFNNNATVARVEAVFQSAEIFSFGDNPTTGVRNLEIVITDGDGGTSNIATGSANLTTIFNDDPSNSGTLPATVTVTEDILTAINLSAMTIADLDANSGALTITLTSSTGGNISAVAGAGITITGTGTNTITLSGTLTDLNNYIDGATNLSYLHSTTNTSGASADSIQVDITDNGNTGNGGGSVITLGIIAVNITSVNDTPVATVPGSQTVTEFTNLTFSTTSTNALSVYDLEAGTVEVTLTASNGLLSLSNITGLVFTTGTGANDTVMTFSGAQLDINNALEGMTFISTVNHFGTGSVQLEVSDLGNTGIGGVLTDTQTIAITINTTSGGSPTGDAFLQGDYIEVGISSDGAFGSNDVAPAGYVQTGSQLGIIGDRDKDGWATYDGDYVLAGTFEEGWGIHVGGSDYNNNNIIASEITGNLSNFVDTGASQSVDWNGNVSGLDIDAAYNVDKSGQFVEVYVYLTNTTGSALNDVYYMRNVDPDNNANQSASDGNKTTNTIISQGNDGSNIARVEATQSDGSYLGLVGFGDNARVTYGGFSNRSAEDIYNGTGGLNQAGSFYADEAISLAFNYSTIAAGETVALRYQYIIAPPTGPGVDLDLDGSAGALGAGYQATFTEGGAAVTIADADAIVFDPDSVNLASMTVALTSNPDGAFEVLAANTSGTSISLVYNSVTGTLTLSGSDTVANYQQVLRTITYNNTSSSPDTTDRVIQVTVNDGVNTSNIATSTITITSVNDAPTATNLSAAETYTEDTALNLIDIVVSDVDSANTTVTLTLSDVGAGALSTANSNGVMSTFVGGVWTASGAKADVNTLLAGVIFNPTLNYNSDFDIATSVSDGFSPAIPGTKFFTAIAVNDAPVLGAIGNQGTNELVNLTFTATATDSDLPADTLTFSLDAASIALGMSIDVSTGVFSWTPTEAQGNTTPSVTVTVTDSGTGNLVDSETFTITVNDVNVAPVLSAIGNQSINELSTLSFTATATDSDLPADTLTFTLDATSVAAGMTIDANTGAFLWTPTEVQGGLTPSVTITVTDNGTGNLVDSETFTITVNDVNVAPILSAIGNQSINELSTLSFTATATDSDLPADTLTFTLDATSVAAGMTINGSTGVFSWTPTEGQGGSAPSVTVTVTDSGTGNLVDSETFTITVADINTAPVLDAIGNQNVDELANLTFTATATDSDLPADTLTFTLDAASVAAGMIIDANTGVFSWTPTEAQGNTTPSVTVTVTDNGTGNLLDSEAFTITVADINTAPILGAIGNQSVDELANLSFTATAIDSDLPADTLTFSLDTASTALGMSIDANTGLFSWTPTTLQGGSIPSVTITVTDNGTGNLIDSETFTIAVNDLPLAFNDSGAGFSTSEDTGFTTGNVLANDELGDLVSSITAFDSTSVNSATITYNNDGTFNYNPAANFNGSDSFTYTLTDNDGDMSIATVTINVTAVNDAPVAQNDSYPSINEGGLAILDLSTNDSDVDDALDLSSIVITIPPLNGNLIINGDGTVTYTHNGSETISDSFNYTISDISGAVSNVATVSLIINPVNDAPVAQNDNTLLVDEGNTANFDLASNDSDADDGLDLNSISIISAPINGGLIVNSNGTVTYTHNGSETLTDSFTYTIADASGVISNVATANIVINPINDTPTTIGITDVTVLEDAANTVVDLNAAFNDADNPDNELTYSVVGNTNIGLFSSTGINATTGQLSLDYAADENGSSQITVRATDLSGTSVDTLFTVNVTPVDDATVVDVNNGVLITEVSERIIDTNMLSAFDIDNTLSEITYTITDQPDNGFILLDGVVATSFTQADLVNNRVSYQVGLNPSGSDQFSFTVTAGSNTLSVMTFDIVISLTPIDPVEPVDPIIPEVLPEPTDPETTDPVKAVDITEIKPDIKVNNGPSVIASTEQVPPPFTPESTPRANNVDAGEESGTDLSFNWEATDYNLKSNFDLKSASSLNDIQVKSIEALWVALDKMKEEINEHVTENMTDAELKAAVVSTSGATLTAGVVAWVLRSGALMTSLISTIPLWKGYDPMPILLKQEEDDEDDDLNEDKIPTSLAEMKRLKALQEKMNNYNQVDAMFSGSEDRG